MGLFDNDLELLQMFVDGARRGKDKTAIIFQRANGQRDEFSYNQIEDEAKKLLKKMKDAGLKKGDRVGVVSSLRPYWYSLYYACLLGEFIMVCIDPGVPASQQQKMMVETDIRALFTSIKVVHVPKELDEHIPVYAIEEGFPLLSKRSKVDFLLSDAQPMKEGTFFVLFSSGTTGENRKAVLLRKETITKAIDYATKPDCGVYKNISPYGINERELILFPPYHIAGLLETSYCFYCNTQIIMLERLTPNGLITVFNELKPDGISTVPSMLTSLYKKIVAGYSKNLLNKTTVNTLISICGFLRRNFGVKAGRKLLSKINTQAFGGNMKRFIIGASPFDPTANKFFLDMGIDVNMAYGLTELGAPLACTGTGYYPGTAGKPPKHKDDIDIRIVHKDETGRGEVEVLSPYRMISYLNEKDNEGCFTEDGYFRTGDLGYFDKNNCLVICGRIKESIVLRNGEKLLPEEIESKYQDMDSVKEVVAFKVPGDGGCDDFAIAITNDKSKGIQDEAVKVRVYERAEKLPQMYRPKDVYIVTELPLSSSHKVQRFRLTEMVMKGESEPVTDASMIPIDEDEVTSELRKILVQVGGSQWKTQQLSQGTLLNIDSLSTVNLYVAIQEKWNIDLFQSSSQPETVGELLDIINNFDVVDKTNKEELDLSMYPLKSNVINNVVCKSLEQVIRVAWKVRGLGTSNFPKDTNFLICPNHRTDIDPAFISSILPRKVLRNTCMVGKDTLITDKFFKQLVISHHFIPIDRTGNSIQTLNRCEELLNEGWNILIFPEGTSVQNNTKLFPLKEGPARLAISTNKPIIPTHITGVAHTDKEMNAFRLPAMKGSIKIKFGKPIYPQGLTPKELNKILAEKIEELN